MKKGRAHTPLCPPSPLSVLSRHPSPAPTRSYKSRSAWAACSMMNLKRASTSLPIQLGQDAVGLRAVADGHAQQPSRGRIQGGPAQLLGLHLAQALKRMTSGFAFLGRAATMRSRSASSSAPEVLCRVHAKQRRLREVDESAWMSGRKCR